MQAGADPRDELERALLAAAAAGDAQALARHYRAAAETAEVESSPDAAAFFRTQALVWALVAGDEVTAGSLARSLRRAGRLD